MLLFSAGPRGLSTSTAKSKSPAPVIGAVEQVDQGLGTEESRGRVWADLNHGRLTEYDQDGRPLGTGQSRTVGRTDWKDCLQRFFLPSNYQTSVSKDYLPTRAWGFAHGVAAGCAHYCSTEAMLSSVMGGVVGPLTVGLVWTLRGSISKVGHIAGSLLVDRADKNPRLWMKVGSLTDIACTMAESTLAAIPHAYLGLAMPTAILRAFAGVMAGAAGAPIGQRQAIANNLGEMATKDGNQNMLASALGGALGFSLQKLLTPACGPMAGAAVAVVAGSLQGFLYTKWLKALEYRPVNQDVLRKMVELGRAPSVQECSDVQGLKRLLVPDPIRLGQPISGLVKQPQRLHELCHLFAGRKYLIELDSSDKPYVVLGQTATPQDLLLALWQSLQIEKLAADSPSGPISQAERREQILKKSLELTPTAPDSILQQLRSAGWSSDCLRFCDSGDRAIW